MEKKRFAQVLNGLKMPIDRQTDMTKLLWIISLSLNFINNATKSLTLTVINVFIAVLIFKVPYEGFYFS